MWSSALGAVLLVLGAESPAFAHDQLLSSDPAESAVLQLSPTEVSLEFSDAVLTVGAVILLVDQGGREWVAAEPNLDGPTVSAPIDGELPDGSYEVRWRVVSSDGHPISGIVPFTVGDEGSQPGASAAEPAEPADSAASDEPAAPVEPAASERSPSAEATSAEQSPIWRTVGIGAAGACGALVLFGAWSFRKRAKRALSDSSN
ncbi:copper resistance CopC family protein [Leucobacter sp. NPDC077196]|uniref:copper resistance CopC family protein n=1 Tax=Leucobacter sp. NPDC077196 TaxID=3154959 RepID=UPI0034480D06